MHFRVPGCKSAFSVLFSDNEFKPKVVETPKDSDGNFLWVCKLMFLADLVNMLLSELFNDTLADCVNILLKINPDFILAYSSVWYEN